MDTSGCGMSVGSGRVEAAAGELADTSVARRADRARPRRPAADGRAASASCVAAGAARGSTGARPERGAHGEEARGGDARRGQQRTDAPASTPARDRRERARRGAREAAASVSAPTKACARPPAAADRPSVVQRPQAAAAPRRVWAGVLREVRSRDRPSAARGCTPRSSGQRDPLAPETRATSASDPCRRSDAVDAASACGAARVCMIDRGPRPSRRRRRPARGRAAPLTSLTIAGAGGDRRARPTAGS